MRAGKDRGILPHQLGKKTLGIGCPRNNKKKFFRFEPKQTETQSVSVHFRFVSVCFGVSDPFRNNRNKQICFETNRKKRKQKQKPNKNSPSNCTRKALTGPTSLDAKPRV
jgi:hypothetical protein